MGDLMKRSTGKRFDRPSGGTKNKPGPKRTKSGDQFKPKQQHQQQSNQSPATPADVRKLQKNRKEFRKRLDPNYDIVVQAKTYWERIRDKENVTKNERKKLITELLNVLEGEMMKLIRKHDGSRVIQSCVKFGTPDHRAKIFTELKDNFYDLASKQYSRFLVLRFITVATKAQKEAIVKEFEGKVVSMVKHKDAADVIDRIYQYSTGLDRCHLLEEFYGKEFVLFKAEKPRTLAELIEAQPDKKETILNQISKTLDSVLEKGLIYLTIIHRVVAEYFENVSVDKIQEFSAALGPHVIHTVRTQHGAQIAAKCVGYSTPKQRKNIIKTLKGEVPNICCERYGHMFIVKLLDVTDDTVLLSKAILKEVMENIDDLLFDVHGRLVILHLLAPGSTRYFNPESMKLLEKNDILDSKKNLVPSSKKDSETRIQELLTHCSDTILESLANNTKDAIFDKHAHAVLVEALRTLSGSGHQKILDNILDLIKRPLEEASKEDPHILTQPTSSMALKILIGEEIEYKTDNSTVFAEAVAKALLDSIQQLAVTDFASGVVAALLKNPTSNGIIKPSLLKVKAKLKKSDIRGTDRILSLLE